MNSDHFRQAFRQGRSVLFVGTGVSMAATEDRKSTWPGLLASGLDYALQRGMIAPDLAQLCLAELESNSDASVYLSVASELTSALGGPSGSVFAEWLSRDIGNLVVKNRRLLAAIVDLNLPIVTTNYDSLLEKVSGRDHVTWQQPGEFVKVLAGASGDIAHFHGYYKEPASVILSRDSYDLLAADDAIVQLRNATSTVTNMVFIGYGSGLEDPNFRSLRNWLGESLAFQQAQHYRLCLDSELEDLRRLHAGESIVPIAFGRSHEDLAPFLESLESAAVGSIWDESKRVFETLEQEVRRNSVLAISSREVADAKVGDLLLPPVIIPIAQDEFSRAVRERALSDRPQRCDPFEEARKPRLIVSGDASTGVTSALHWLVTRKHLEDDSLLPVVVSARVLRTGADPIDREVRKALRSAGYSIGNSGKLPPLALGIDDLSAGNETVLRRIMGGLVALEDSHVVIGTASGNENEIEKCSSDLGLTFEPRFLGRMSRRDVQDLAALVDPRRARDLADQTVSVARAHHLRSTPFTFSMILSAIMRGESLAQAANQTSLLDAYVAILMGWGRDDEDSRTGLDLHNRTTVLERLAEVFVKRRRGSLPAEDVVAELRAILNGFEWEDDPVDLLSDLKGRRILSIRQGHVSFAQSSYLHLFAAKRAASRSGGFLDYVRKQPLFHAPILKHYAALTRDDQETLSVLAALVTPFAHEIEFDGGSFAESDDDGAMPSSDEAAVQSIRDETQIIAREEELREELDPLEASDESDVEPFPLIPVDEMPEETRRLLAVSLVSVFLRDTENIEDPIYRRAVLADCVTAWANVTYALEADEELRDSARALMRELDEAGDLDEDQIETNAKKLHAAFAFSMTSSGVVNTLSSKKLARSLNSCLDDPAFCKNAGRHIFGVLLAMDTQAEGWASRFLDLHASHGMTPGVRVFTRYLANRALVRQRLTKHEEALLLDFLVESSAAERGKTKDPAWRSAYRQNVQRAVTAARMTAAPSLLPAGHSVLSETSVEDD